METFITGTFFGRKRNKEHVKGDFNKKNLTVHELETIFQNKRGIGH